MKHTRLIIFLWLAAVFFYPGSRTSAGETIHEVTSASPSWKGFTNKDGTGLYHEILLRVFEPHKIRVVHTYTNAVRGIHLVSKDLVDFYTCRADVTDFQNLMLARHPMYEGQVHAFFNRQRIGKWQGMTSFTGKRVVWRRGYYKPSEFKAVFTMVEADSGILALSQVVYGRADFYVDDPNLISESVSKATFPFDMKDYGIVMVKTRTYHPVFKRSARGEQLMDLYDRGVEKLHGSGELKKIFEKWNFPYPSFFPSP